jgi:hypothetical protein
VIPPAFHSHNFIVWGLNSGLEFQETQCHPNESIEIRRRRLVKFSLLPPMTPLPIENPRAVLEVITEKSLSFYFLRCGSARKPCRPSLIQRLSRVHATTYTETPVCYPDNHLERLRKAPTHLSEQLVPVRNTRHITTTSTFFVRFFEEYQ